MEFARIKKGVNVSGDSGNPINCQPSWMDLEKFQRGQNFFVKHAAAIVLALHCSLTIGFAVSRLTESLVFNKGSDTSKKARRRYFETLVHVILWHITDVWDSDTPSLSHQSLAFVRQMHNRVAKAMNDVKESITIAGQKNSDFNIYISQYDLACVQAGFIGAVILHPDRFGIARPTANELSDYVFFWRGIGYLLGIDDDHNICSRGLAVAREICLSVEDELAFPGLYQPSSEFHRMADAYIDGINGKGGGDRSFRMFSKESLIAFWFYVKDRHMSLLPSWLQLSYSDYMRLWVLKGTMFMLKWCPGFERLFNWYILNYVFKSLLPLVEKQLARRN